MKVRSWASFGFLVFVLVAMSLYIWGCGSGGSSGGTNWNPLGAGDLVNALRGRILASDTIVVRWQETSELASGVRAAGKDGLKPISRVEVWIELFPTIHGQTDASGSYLLSGVPVGTHRVVAKLTAIDGRTVFKMRSDPVEIIEGANATDVEDLLLKEARNRVAGVLLNKDGNPLPAGTVLTLWGETFTVGEGGRFLSPPLPEGFDLEQIVVEPSATNDRLTFSVPFIADAAPPEITIMVPEKGKTGNGAPVLFLDSRRGGVPCSEVSPGEVLTLIASASDPDPVDAGRLRIVWQTDQGTLATSSTDPFRAFWTAMDHPGMANIDATIYDGDGAWASFRLKVLVGIEEPPVGPIDAIAPVILAVSPASGAIDLPVGSPVTVTFNEPLATLTVNLGTFIVTAVGDIVSGTVTLASDGRTITFIPATTLGFGSLITVTIDGIKDLAGNPCACRVWEFRTALEPDLEAPAILPWYSPGANATGVATLARIIIPFTEPLAMASVSTQTIRVASGTSLLPGTLALASAGREVIFTPTSGFPYDSRVTVTVATGILDLAGIPLVTPLTWTFSTQPAPDLAGPFLLAGFSPGENAVGVGTMSPVLLPFSEPLGPESVGSATIMISSGATGIPGRFSLDPSGQTVLFEPSEGFPYGSRITVTITQAVRDQSGNPHVGDRSWSFQIVPVPPPPALASPTSLVAYPGHTTVLLEWDPVPGATAYQLYWTTGSTVASTTGTRISLASTTFLHTGRANLTTYAYAVTALGGAGESALSTVVSTKVYPSPVLPGGQTVVLQPGPEGKDTFFGTTYIPNGQASAPLLYNGGWADYYYDFFEFDLAAGPSATETASVTLLLCSTFGDRLDPAFQVHRLTVPWTETGVTRYQNPAAVFQANWGPFNNQGAWNRLDLTDLYRDWKAGVLPNHGIKLVPTANSRTNGAIFSSDYRNPELRPMLVIQTRVPDTTAPVPVFSAPVASVTSQTAILVTLDFGEEVAGFEASDLVLTNATVEALSGSGGVYSFSLLMGGQGSCSVFLPAGAVMDAAGLANLPSSYTVVFDSLGPSPVMGLPTGGLYRISPVVLPLSFTEPVTDFTLADLTVASCTVDGIAGSGATYTISISPFGNGPFSIGLIEGGVLDQAGNPNLGATWLGEFDDLPPAGSLVSKVGPVTATSPIPFEIGFPEPVYGFTGNDLVIGNGTITGFASGGASSFTFALTPAASGSVTVWVPAGICSDQAGNPNSEIATLTSIYDPALPTVALVATASEPTNSRSFQVDVRFDKPVTGFEPGDLVVTVNSVVMGGLVTGFTGSGSEYSFVLTSPADGLVEATLPENSAFDAAGQGNPAAQFRRVIDSLAPGGFLSSVADDPTATSPIPVEVGFTEAVYGFDASDVVVSNGTVATFTVIGPASFAFSLVPVASGPVTAWVPAGRCVDAASNTNAELATLTRVYDPSPPAAVLVATDTDPTNNPAMAVEVLFDRLVTGFSDTDLVVTVDSVVTTGAVLGFGGTGASYSFTLAPPSDGLVEVSLLASVAFDVASFGNLPATFSRVYDSIPPTVSGLLPAPNATSVPHIQVIVASFSEPVNFASLASSSEVSSGTDPIPGSFSLSPDGRLATFTPGSPLPPYSQITVTIGTSTTDLAGNQLGNAYSWTFATKRAIPGLTINQYPGNPVLPFSGSGFDATRVTEPKVVYASGTYYLFYNGLPFGNEDETGVATSSDGITWNRMSNPVILNNPQAWCSYRMTPSAARWEENTFKLWFRGDTGDVDGNWGYASSADGIHWDLLPTNPIPALYGLQTMVKLGNTYHAYCYRSGDGKTYHSTSTDGISFVDQGIIASDGMVIYAATESAYLGTPFIFSLWWDGSNWYHAISKNGTHFAFSSTPVVFTSGTPTPYSLLIEGDLIRVYQAVWLGNINWSYGNAEIWYGNASAPDFIYTVDY